MPIHDWTRVNAGIFHDFLQGWTIEIRRTLNKGVIPSGYVAMADQRVSRLELDNLDLQLHEPSSLGGLESEQEIYARKANRIAIRHQLGRVVAIIEIVSPGNKDSKHAIRSFTAKAVDFLSKGINLVVIDLFPPTPRDPDGIHHAIWDELVGEPFGARPPNKPLTVAGYDAGHGPTAYVDPVAVGDHLPDAPLFLAPERYVDIPLEKTYQASWDMTPQPIRDLVEPPGV
jgi:hypothetical protein